MYDLVQKGKVRLPSFFTRPFRGKLTTSEYTAFETVQLLSETFFNIVESKRDISDDALQQWYTRYIAKSFRIK